MRTANMSSPALPAIWSPFPITGTCKVMPFGTSITKGKYGDNSQDPNGGYRGPLFTRLKAASSRVDLVGSQSDVANAGSGHEGYAGITIAGVSAFLASRLTTYTPHAISVELGMNDPDDAATATSLATSIVDVCFATLPGSLVLVQTVIPVYAGAGRTGAFNAQLALEIGNRRAAGKHVELVDEGRLSGLIPGVVDYSEPVTWIHPSAIGYPKMAGPMFDHLVRYL